MVSKAGHVKVNFICIALQHIFNSLQGLHVLHYIRAGLMVTRDGRHHRYGDRRLACCTS